jgi:hypothetical protein
MVLVCVVLVNNIVIVQMCVRASRNVRVVHRNMEELAGSSGSNGSGGSGGGQPEGQMVHSVSSSSSVGGVGEERRTRKVSVLQQFENNLRKSGHARGFSEPCQTPAGTAEMWATKNDVQFTIDLPSDLCSGTTRSHIPVAVKARWCDRCERYQASRRAECYEHTGETEASASRYRGCN